MVGSEQGCKLVRGEKGDKLNSTPPPLYIYIYIYIYIHMGGNRRVPHDTIYHGSAIIDILLDNHIMIHPDICLTMKTKCL